MPAMVSRAPSLRHGGAQGFRHGQGGLGVAAGAVAAQVRGAFGEGGGEDRALRETLGRRHPAAFRPVGLAAAVERARHFGHGPLSGGGGFFLGERGIGEGGASAQAFQARVASRCAHAEGDQPPLQRIHALQHDGVEGFDAGGVLRRVAGGHDLGDVRAVAEAAREGHLQDLDVRGVLEIVVGADDLRAALAAELLEALAHRGRGLDLEVREAGARLDGEAQPPLRFLLGGGFRDAAGRDERRVGLAEEFFYLSVGEGAAVQADFRHLDRGVREDLEDLLEGLILQAGANHPSL